LSISKKGLSSDLRGSELPHARVVASKASASSASACCKRLDAELVRRGEPSRHGSERSARLPELAANAHPGNGQSARAAADAARPFWSSMSFRSSSLKTTSSRRSGALLESPGRQGPRLRHPHPSRLADARERTPARTTIDQMAIRIALQCSEATLTLSSAKTMPLPGCSPGPASGHNAANGLREGNHLFQIVWLSDQEANDILRQIRQFASRREPRREQIVFEGTALRLSQECFAPPGLDRHRSSAGKRSVAAWLEKRVAIKEPTTALFRRQSGHNLLIVGQDTRRAFQMAVAAMVSFEPRVCHGERALQLVVASPLTSAARRCSMFLPEVLPLARCRSAGCKPC